VKFSSPKNQVQPVGLPEDESVKATGSGAAPETGLPVKLTVGAPAPQPVTDGMIASDMIIRKKRAARKDLAGIRSESTTTKNNSSFRSDSTRFREIHFRDKKHFYFTFMPSGNNNLLRKSFLTPVKPSQPFAPDSQRRV
jgi:hypothetical protein